ncbi:glycosyltransferase [Carboxylicivirga marina]|uniref:glycosyltransferase n=1 Tax=Carboxylicivirga marina TaxID=2800988 RepID=UPI002595CF50|nr:glycosyltransferase [uncultured Carboxylicivirga sp.]
MKNSPKLKILILPSFWVYPYTSGGSTAQIIILKSLQEIHDITLGLRSDNIEAHQISELQKEIPNVNLRLIKNESKGIGNLVNRVINKLILIKYKNLPFQPFYQDIQLIWKTRKIIKNGSFDIIQIEMFKSAFLVKAIPKKTRSIFINHEPLIDRYNSQKCTEKQIKTVKKYENYWLSKFNYCFCFTKENKNQLLKHYSNLNIFVAPYAIDSNPKNIFLPIQKSDNKKMVFMGGESHLPNKVALSNFIDNVFSPLLEKDNSFQLYITSLWSDQFRNKYLNPNIHFIGFIENITPLIKNSLIIAPVNIGSGLRTKVLFGLSKGIPVLSVPKSVEGLEVTHKKDILIAFEDNEMIKLIMDFFGSTDLQKTLSQYGFQYFNKNFSIDKLAKKRTCIYKSIMLQDN